MDELYAVFKEKMQENAFMVHNHMEIELVERDRAVFRLTVHPDSKNPFGIVHGGAFFALADNAAGVAAATIGYPYVTQQATLHFLKNVSEGVIRADARIRHRGSATCLVTVDMTSEDGTLLATGELSFFKAPSSSGTLPPK